METLRGVYPEAGESQGGSQWGHLEACRELRYSAEHGAVFLRQGDALQLVQTAGAWNGEAHMSLPLEYQGAQIGLVSLCMRRHGLDYSSQDKQTLQQTAEVVAHAIGLSGRAT